MATTANARITRRDSDKGSIPVAATKVLPANGLVFRNDAGFATDVVASGANPFLGLAEKMADNSTGAAGDINVEVWREGQFLLPFTGSTLTQADIGKNVFATDNNVLTLTSTDRPFVGVLTEFVSATLAYVDIVVGRRGPQGPQGEPG
jgi:predicted RecA/RadA family phage recombinase